jgi:LuxR family maltose regulon positive regulatory protein
MLSAEIPLLQTKLDVPPPRAHTLPREWLLALIPRAPGTRLLLLSAPAGFGKTTLLATWCHALGQQRGAAIAWLALDESDNDPARFTAYLVASLTQALAPQSLGGPTPAAPDTSSTGTEILLTQLVNTISAIDCDLVLVLDDYHLISAPAVHAAVAFLIEHLPSRACLAIGSRADPPLPLARLRARAQLVELRAADLRFTPNEVQAFFATSELALTPEEAQAIGEHVEGWPAGVQLVALALRAAPNEWAAELGCPAASPPANGVLGRLGGSEQHVFAYLADDVFEQQPAHRKSFLLQTAILDRMCGALCDAIVLGNRHDVIGDRDNREPPSPITHHLSPNESYSRLILEELERANLFVTPLDGQHHWYRYHHLFRAFLCARLERESPGAVAELHRRASAWYEQHRLLQPAVEHALQAGAVEHAVALIEASAAGLIGRGEYATLHGWLDQIPECILAARPALCLWAAWAALLAGEVARIEPPLQRAERAWRAERNRPGLGEIAHLRAHLARLRLDVAQTIAAARQALADLAEPQRAERSGSLLALGAGQLLAGDLAAAEATLAEALAQCQADNFLGTLVALRCLGDIAALRGQIGAAAAKYQEVIAQVGTRDLWERWAAAIRLADLARERNDLAGALDLLQAARLAAERVGVAVYLPDGYIALARTLQARGDTAAAALMLDRGLHAADGLGSQVYTQLIHAEQARLALAQGDLEAAYRWQQARAPELAGPLDSAGEAEAAILARVLIAQARQAPGSSALHAARAILARLRDSAAARGRAGSIIELLALAALADAAAGNRARAIEAIQQALLLAMPEGYARIFLDEGAPMRALIADYQSQLARAAGSGDTGTTQQLQGYIEQLLAAFPDCKLQIADCRLAPEQSAMYNLQSAIVEPLSERELEVLRLIADGASNQAIADALVISIGTVKSHINHILGKLSAANRTEAVSRARALGLLGTF